MRVLLQRVSEARVRVEGRVVGEIGAGLLLFLACCRGDGPEQARELARRVASYRVFPDSEGRSNLSLLDVQGEALLVSQFTLAADTGRGRRPSFDPALPPAAAEPLVALFAATLRGTGTRVAEGVFGASMEVELRNQGPATYLLERWGGSKRT